MRDLHPGDNHGPLYEGTPKPSVVLITYGTGKMHEERVACWPFWDIVSLHVTLRGLCATSSLSSEGVVDAFTLVGRLRAAHG